MQTLAASYIHKKTWWQNGVVLEHEESKALIKFSAYDKKVVINISGESIKKRQNLLAIIRKEFKDIQGEFAVLPVNEFAVHPTIKIVDESGRKLDLLKDYDELLGIEEAGGTEVFVKELKKYLPVNDWLDGVEDRNVRLRNRDHLERENKYQAVAVNPYLGQLQSELVSLRKEKNELDHKKEKIEERADVWATVTRWLAGILVSSGLGYLIYWYFKHSSEIERDWTKYEMSLAFVGIVVSTLLIIFFLIKKTKISEETTIDFIEDKIKKILYGKHKFDLEKYLSVCSKIEQKETEIKKLDQ